MGRRAFWPGFRWRILAHERTDVGKKGGYTGRTYDRRAGKGPLAMADGPTDVQYVNGEHWEFDELCIDHWFHLEQMGDRVWWLGLGDPDHGDYFHVWIEVKGDKTVSVRFEDQA